MSSSDPETTGPLSALEASRRAGISKRAIIAAIERGALKAQKLPGPRGQYVIQPKDFVRYQAKRAEKASA